jgi:hypothetical protein
LTEDLELHAPLVIDDLSRPFPESAIGATWHLFTDQVMGGVSRGRLSKDHILGQPAIRMQGDVSLDNNGGFIQMSLTLADRDGAFDASAWRGIAIDIAGVPGAYEMRLRTTDLSRPWESYRHTLSVEPNWKTHQLHFADFTLHRTDVPLNLQRLRRLGLVAIGRAFSADLALGGIRYFS